MADLSPDLSPYAALAKSGQSGVGAMDPGSILGLIQRSRDLQTQQATSDALRASGNNPSSALSALMQSGAAGFMSPELYTQLTHAAAAQQEFKTGQFTRMSNIAGSILAQKGPITDDTMYGLAGEMQRSGIDPKAIQDYTNSIPPESDQAGRRRAIAQMQLLASGHAADVNWRPIGVGGAQLPVTGAQEFGAAVSGPQGGGTQPTSAPTPRTAPGVPSSEAPEDTAANVANEVRATLPRPGTMAAPSPADQIKFDSSGKQYATDLSQTSDYRNNINALEKLIPTLRKLGPEGTGAPTALVAAMTGFLHNIGVPVPTNQTQLLQTAKKYMANVVGNLSKGETDARYWNAQTGSPNPELLQQTNLSLAKQMLGLQRMHLGQVAEYQRTGSDLGGGYYTDWGSRWNAQQDPTAYAWDAYTPDERKEYLDGIGADKNAGVRKRFRSSLAAADRTKGLFPGQQ